MLEAKQNSNGIDNDELDLMEVLRVIWKNRRIIYYSIGFSLLLGCLIAFGSKIEYESTCKLMPEMNDEMNSDLGGLGSLAGLAGFNFNVANNVTLTPDLYPQIVQSVPFLWRILKEKIYFEKYDTSANSYEYFNSIDKPSLLEFIEKYTLDLPEQILQWLNSTNNSTQMKEIDKDGIVKISKKETKLLEKFAKRLNVEVDEETGIIFISGKMPDKNAAADITHRSVILLTEYVTNYKIGKVRENLEFIEDRFMEAKLNFEESQLRLARFNDMNHNVVTAYSQAEREKLQNENNITFEVYKGLSTQLEQAKIKVKEKTPVFTVLEPVKVPIKKSYPKRLIILMGSLIIGSFFGIVLIIGKQSIKIVESRWKV